LELIQSVGIFICNVHANNYVIWNTRLLVIPKASRLKLVQNVFKNTLSPFHTNGYRLLETVLRVVPTP
jgi:hypothetical protein